MTTAIASNDNWDATTTPAATQRAVGGFDVPASSRDAVLILNLGAGNYSAQISGIGGITGVGGLFPDLQQLVEFTQIDA